MYFSLLWSHTASSDSPEIFFPLVFFVLLFSPHFPNQGRSVSKAPGRGNHSPHSISQVSGPMTCTSSPPHKATSPTLYIAPRSLVIDPRLTLVITRPRLAKQSHSSHIDPESIDPSLDTSRQPCDKTTTSRDRCDYEEHVPLFMTTAYPESDKHVTKAYTTTELCIGQLLNLEEKTSLSKDQLSGGQDGSQYPNHGSILPSLGRPRVFRRNFTMAPLLMTGPSARDLRLKGSNMTAPVEKDSRCLSTILKTSSAC